MVEWYLVCFLFHSCVYCDLLDSKYILHNLDNVPSWNETLIGTLDLDVNKAMNQSFFTSLENYQVNATPVSEEKYPWIARVVHSRNAFVPHVCTAVCIEKKIFITAARCIAGLKVSMTSVVYQYISLPVIAFVTPANASKQAFDDIAFVVINPYDFNGFWETKQLYKMPNRTDENFNWFAAMNLAEDVSSFKAVGYTTLKDLRKLSKPDKQFDLYEMHVFVGIKLCREIMSGNLLVKGFHVPCYHSCTLKDFFTRPKPRLCFKYHGSEGSAVIDVKQGKLLGIATWGGNFYMYPLPVGFSIPNSANYYEDLECARRISRDVDGIVNAGHFKNYYQNLCDK